jgi:predicted transcriptional regulator
MEVLVELGSTDSVSVQKNRDLKSAKQKRARENFNEIPVPENDKLIILIIKQNMHAGMPAHARTHARTRRFL